METEEKTRPPVKIAFLSGHIYFPDGHLYSFFGPALMEDGRDIQQHIDDSFHDAREAQLQPQSSEQKIEEVKGKE